MHLLRHGWSTVHAISGVLAVSLRLHCLFHLSLLALLFTLLKTFITMTVATALLQATSLIATLSQLRTNGKYSQLLLQILRVLLLSREKLCLQFYHQGGSTLGTLAVPKLPQFLENK